MAGNNHVIGKLARNERAADDRLSGAAAIAYKQAVEAIEKLDDERGLIEWREHVTTHRYTGKQWWISDMIIERINERIERLN